MNNKQYALNLIAASADKKYVNEVFHISDQFVDDEGNRIEGPRAFYHFLTSDEVIEDKSKLDEVLIEWYRNEDPLVSREDETVDNNQAIGLFALAKEIPNGSDSK